MIRVGSKIMLTDDALMNYGNKYRGKKFKVTSIAKNSDQHRGYDEAMEGMSLYDCEGLPFSVYEWEVEKA